MKKEWYKTWWGILICVLFFYIAVPYLVWTKTNWNKNIKIIITAICVVFFIFIRFTNPSSNSSNSSNSSKNTTPKTENITPKKVEVVDTKTEEEKKEEIKKNVETEKKRIRAEFIKYDEYHQKTWQSLTESLGKSEIFSSYDYAKQSKEKLQEIYSDLSKLECNATGDSDFDSDCKQILKDAKTAYTLKRNAAIDLMDWLEDVNSPKKATKAKDSLESGGKFWQTFQLKLAATTITEEEFKQYQEEAKKESKK